MMARARFEFIKCVCDWANASGRWRGGITSATCDQRKKTNLVLPMACSEEAGKRAAVAHLVICGACVYCNRTAWHLVRARECPRLFYGMPDGLTAATHAAQCPTFEPSVENARHTSHPSAHPHSAMLPWPDSTSDSHGHTLARLYLLYRGIRVQASTMKWERVCTQCTVLVLLEVSGP